VSTSLINKYIVTLINSIRAVAGNDVQRSKINRLWYATKEAH